MLHWQLVNDSMHMNQSLTPIHQRQARGWTGCNLQVLGVTRREIEPSLPTLVMHGQPTVPLSWFRPDIMT